ncbi:FAD-dependent oxidoreductase [Actinobacteria bacterium YIM 96077]|uniref:FAD-dependent oxidoreductase n=1 Tax=Phytoactinopolyspora halophila TaxID=1981511 RepID=A0A329QY54_9ACTN|nr:FAD-dependent oxidoreductase [Phytoactinopolyspora halophila]AYY13411.1 FAD-dependent oxidoreductase [Actinobacteria bacterium YIM 96077]RAW17354.1 FAD-dependent oxidoreductase [Phytoactinopolyspora halophila]
MSTSYDLIVIGAGPAGLAAAWRAALRGFSVALLERADHVGGMAASVDVAGIRVDQGSHRLDRATPGYLLADLRELMGDDLQLRQRSSRIRVLDNWLSVPLRADEVTRRLPRSLLARIARDSATTSFRRGGNESYASVVRSRVGPALYETVYGPLAEKQWGIPGDCISAVQAYRQASRLSAWKVAGRAVGRIRRKTQEIAGGYYYPRHGFGRLVETLADAGAEAGVDIKLEAEVDRVRVYEDEVEVATQDGDVVRGGLVFSTLPLPLLARISRPAPSLTSIESAARLRYRAMLLVYIVHKGGRWSPYDSHDIPDQRTPVLRISEPMNYRDNPDDPSDRSVLCAEIPCSMTDEVWGLDDESLADLVDETLGMTGLPGVERAHVETRRLGQVYPIYRLGYEDDLTEVDAWARMIRRIVTLGRQGLFVFDNVHQALLMAYDAVDAIREDGRFDRYAWTVARERFAKSAGHYH